MLAQERQAIIVRLLQENHFIKITDIAQRFNIATLTARRDLDVLQDQHIIRRVYGGAVLLGAPQEIKSDSPLSLPAAEAVRHATAEKQAIGAMAASLVQEGDVVTLGYGNTVLEVAKHLKHMSNLTIFATSLVVINELASSNNTVYVIGGKLDPGEQFIHGAWAERMIQNFCADKAFIGCDGFSLKNGVTGATDMGSSLGKLVIQQAKQSILVCSSQKYNADAMCVSCALRDIDVIVTDSGLAEEHCESIRRLGIDLRLAPVCQEK